MKKDHYVTRYWRDWPTVRNTKIAFILLHEDGEDIPPELLDAIIEQFKKDVEYETATITDGEARAWRLYKAVRDQPKGTTKTAIFAQFAKEEGISEEWVKEKYYKDVKRFSR